MTPKQKIEEVVALGMIFVVFLSLLASTPKVVSILSAALTQ